MKLATTRGGWRRREEAMFIDFLALMLVNLVIGLVLLAIYIVFFLDTNGKRIAPGFLVPGIILPVAGFRLIFTWPLPGSYNIAYGELAVLVGVLFFVAWLALTFEWDLLSVGVVAVLASIAAVIVGLRIINLKMTTEPSLEGIGFIATGLGGILTLPSYLLRKSLAVRIVTAIVLLVGAAIFALTGYAEYWTHLSGFAKWLPDTMRAAAAAK